MSRLWNKFSSWLWPSAPGSVAISISGNRVTAVRVARTGDGYCVTHAAEVSLPFMPFHDASPRGDEVRLLSEAMQRLATAVPQAYWPLQIALPDPAAIFQVMEFDSLPRAAQERAAIARFRMKKEWPDVSQMDCTFQVLNEKEGEAMLLALAVRRSWLDCLRDACRAAGFVPNVTDIGLNHLFNRLHDAVCPDANDGALISIEPDSWSILFWDNAQRPRFARSCWRDARSEKGADHETLAQDIERLVRAYVFALPGRRIQKIYLCAGMAERELFAAALNARMRVPCIQLDMTEGFLEGTGIRAGDVSPGALAAAIPRII